MISTEYKYSFSKSNISSFAVSYLLPVGGYLRQVEGLTEVHQIQHILLETASTET